MDLDSTRCAPIVDIRTGPFWPEAVLLQVPGDPVQQGTGHAEKMYHFLQTPPSFTCVRKISDLDLNLDPQAHVHSHGTSNCRATFVRLNIPLIAKYSNGDKEPTSFRCSMNNVAGTGTMSACSSVHPLKDLVDSSSFRGAYAIITDSLFISLKRQSPHPRERLRARKERWKRFLQPCYHS